MAHVCLSRTGNSVRSKRTTEKRTLPANIFFHRDMTLKRRKKPERVQRQELSALIKEALKNEELRQKALINALPLTQREANKGRPTSQSRAGTYIKEIMNGKRVPDLKYLIDIMVAIRSQAERPEKTFSNRIVSLWLASWLTSMIERFSKELKTTLTNKPKEPPKSRTTLRVPVRKGFGYWAAHEKDASSLLNQASKAAKQWRRSTATLTFPSSTTPTLRAKDQILRDCIIIVGASVRYPPSSTLDLFRENSHLSDLMYLPNFDFGDDPLLLTDRMVIALEEKDRKRILGHKHLLVIGGPKVNVATRYLNDGLVFPFCFNQDKRSFDNLFDDLKAQGNLANERAVELFYEMLQEPNDDINLRDERFKRFKPEPFRAEVRDEVLWFRDRFLDKRPLGYEQVMDILTGEKKLFDPIAKDVIRPKSKDHLGVVTLGRNFWAQNDQTRVCIVVAGIDTYGTAGALKALVESDFQHHPLGGVVKATVKTSISEYEQFTSTLFEWSSRPYEISSLARRLSDMRKDLSISGRPIHQAFHGDVDRFDEYQNFIERFQD